MNASITVVNVRDVGVAGMTLYIGRANRFYGLGASPLSNPFRLKPDLGEDRAAVVAFYAAFFYTSTPEGERRRAYARRAYARHLLERPGEPFTLGCWCAPAACHGDVIAAYLRSLEIVSGTHESDTEREGVAS